MEKPQIDIRDKGFTNLPSLSSALVKVFENLHPLGIETIDLRKISHNTINILAEDAIAVYSVPNFTRGTMDGFAVRSGDLLDASDSNKITFDVIEELTITSVSSQQIEKNQAIKVVTGGTLPKGADCVIKIEDVEIISTSSQYKISTGKQLQAGKNVSFKGEDYKQGDIIFEKGRMLTPVDLGVLLSIGISTIKCYKIPTIGIVATGDEIVDESRILEPGEVFDSNSYVLQQYLTQLGFKAKRYKGIKDDFELLKNQIQSIIKECDFIITSGGTSVGPRDFTPLLLNEFSNVLIHGIAIKPGSPTTFGVKNGKYFLGLPGFPVSSLLSFAFFGMPILLKLLGANNVSFLRTKAIMTDDHDSDKGKTGFLRVSLSLEENQQLAKPIMLAGSSLLRTLSTANGVVVIDEKQEKVSKDQIVDVVIIDKLVNYSNN